jgi:hypothetical protein
MITMVSEKESRLSRLYEQLRHQAGRRPGEVQRCPLPGGARMSLTIQAGRAMLVFARRGKRLGDTELITFRAHCEVPERARRVPEQGQTEREGGWFIVAYVWEGEVL